MASIGDLYGISTTDLQAIIRSTDEAIQRMHTVGSGVGASADGVRSANRSDSGTIIQGNLIQWQQDYNQVVTSLQTLNEKANNLLANSNNVMATTTSQAR
jgi:hypothetical protein